MPGQYDGMQQYETLRRWYQGTNAPTVIGSPYYYNLDPVGAPPIPAWDPSVDPGPNTITIDGARSLLGHAVMDVPANGATLTGTSGSAGTVNTNNCMLAGVLASVPQPAQGNTNPLGPCYLDLIEAVPSRVVPIAISYNNALPGDVVIADEATPSNTFIQLVPQSGTLGGVNISTTNTFATNNAGVLTANNTTGNTEFPWWRDMGRAKFVLMNKGPTASVTTTNTALVLARVL